MTSPLFRILSLFVVVVALVMSNAHAADWVQPAALNQHAANDVLEPGVAPDKGRFLISRGELADAVSDVLQQEGVADDVKASVLEPMKPAIYQANVPIQLKLHAMRVSATRQAWQAEAYIMSGGKTLSVMPVSGRYEIMQRIPVLSRVFGSDDIIESGDLSYITLPERQLRKDTIRDAKSLIGNAPRNQISANRPIRATEVTKPRLVEKKAQVEMLYSSQYLTIRSVGQALEDGAEGELIRVKNADTDRTVTARVVGAGKVEVNLARTM